MSSHYTQHFAELTQTRHWELSFHIQTLSSYCVTAPHLLLYPRQVKAQLMVLPACLCYCWYTLAQNTAPSFCLYSLEISPFVSRDTHFLAFHTVLWLGVDFFEVTTVGKKFQTKCGQQLLQQLPFVIWPRTAAEKDWGRGQALEEVLEQRQRHSEYCGGFTPNSQTPGGRLLTPPLVGWGEN